VILNYPKPHNLITGGAANAFQLTNSKKMPRKSV